MMYYTKESVRINHRKTMTTIDTLYMVCFAYIIIFIINILSYYDKVEEGADMRPNEDFLSYAASMTGALCLFAAFILPFILKWYSKRVTEVYKSEMDKPGEKLYYN